MTTNDNKPIETWEASVCRVLSRQPDRKASLSRLCDLVMERREALGIKYQGRTAAATIRRVVQQSKRIERVGAGVWLAVVDPETEPRS